VRVASGMFRYAPSPIRDRDIPGNRASYRLTPEWTGLPKCPSYGLRLVDTLNAIADTLAVVF
jgi:hypothetical protein